MTTTPDTDPAAEVVEAWQDLLDKSDRTSPVEYPEMALITYEELADYMAASHAALAQQLAELSSANERMARLGRVVERERDELAARNAALHDERQAAETANAELRARVEHVVLILAGAVFGATYLDMIADVRRARDLLQAALLPEPAPQGAEPGHDAQGR